MSVDANRAGNPPYAQESPDPPYNPIFDQIREAAADDAMIAYVAYGIYKQDKQEWAKKIAKKNCGRPTQQQLDDYVEGWGSERIKSVVARASEVVNDYAFQAAEAQKEAIISIYLGDLRKDVLRFPFWQTMGTSIAATFAYSILLVAAMGVLTVLGVDLLSGLKWVAGK